MALGWTDDPRNADMRAYECSYCDGWHVGHPPLPIAEELNRLRAALEHVQADLEAMAVDPDRPRVSDVLGLLDALRALMSGRDASDSPRGAQSMDRRPMGR
jgi:hypothetical protein